MKELECIILDERLTDFDIPHHATSGSAGIDLRAMIETLFIYLIPNETILIPTGIAVNIKDPNYAIVLLPRSGLGHKEGLVLGNLTGLIDSDYQGQLFVSLWNRSKLTRRVEFGDRIAQMVMLPVEQMKLSIVKKFTPSDRGEGAFGHTGKN